MLVRVIRKGSKSTLKRSLCPLSAQQVEASTTSGTLYFFTLGSLHLAFKFLRKNATSGIFTSDSSYTFTMCLEVTKTEN